jgi:hypothetical protein
MATDRLNGYALHVKGARSAFILTLDMPLVSRMRVAKALSFGLSAFFALGGGGGLDANGVQFSLTCKYRA